MHTKKKEGNSEEEVDTKEAAVRNSSDVLLVL